MSANDGNGTDPGPGHAGDGDDAGARPPDAGARRSAAFGGEVGVAVPASSIAREDYLVDPSRFPSEGNWAFCRFESDEVPAIRLGFELGGFNPGAEAAAPKPTYLQLHLEVMTDEGALFWLPSGQYSAADVVSDPDRMDVRFEAGGREVFSLHGWPSIACHFRSDDGDLEVNLQFDLTSVSVLPDALLPHCVFAMWESIGRAHGEARYRDRTIPLDGTVFFDHPRVIERRHDVTPRQMYVYTTLRLEDGGGLFGYYALDTLGRPIEDYCFCVYVDAAGRGRLLSDGVLARLDLDEDDIARSWHLTWRDAEVALETDVTVRPGPILRSWGGPNAPQTRREFGFPPLVLDATVQIHERGATSCVARMGAGRVLQRRPGGRGPRRCVEPGPPAG